MSHGIMFLEKKLLIDIGARVWSYYNFVVNVCMQSINQSIYLTNCAQNMYIEQEMI